MTMFGLRRPDAILLVPVDLYSSREGSGDKHDRIEHSLSSALEKTGTNEMPRMNSTLDT